MDDFFSHSQMQELQKQMEDMFRGFGSIEFEPGNVYTYTNQYKVSIILLGILHLYAQIVYFCC